MSTSSERIHVRISTWFWQRHQVTRITGFSTAGMPTKAVSIRANEASRDWWVVTESVQLQSRKSFRFFSHQSNSYLTLIRLSSWYEFRFNWETKLGLADLISGMDRLGEKETPKGSSFSTCVIMPWMPLLNNTEETDRGFDELGDDDWWVFLW